MWLPMSSLNAIFRPPYQREHYHEHTTSVILWWYTPWVYRRLRETMGFFSADIPHELLERDYSTREYGENTRWVHHRLYHTTSFLSVTITWVSWTWWYRVNNTMIMYGGNTMYHTMSFLNVTKSSSATSCSYTALLMSSFSLDASRASTKSPTSTPTSARLVAHRLSTLRVTSQ